MKIKIQVNISNIFNKSTTLRYLQMFETTGKKLISFGALCYKIGAIRIICTR